MAKLKYTVPVVGEKNTTAEPKVDTALAEILKVVNGELDHENLREHGINESNLSEALITKLAEFVGLPLESKKSIIATEQSRESATYGTLATPDEVTVTVPENGLIAVAFHASWANSVAEDGRAAIFVNGAQLNLCETATVAAVGPKGTVAEKWATLVSSPIGLVGSAASTIFLEGLPFAIGSMGGTGTPGGYNYETFATGVELEIGKGVPVGGEVKIAAAAGTYKVQVQYKSAAGKVTVKGRKLWAWVIG